MLSLERNQHHVIARPRVNLRPENVPNRRELLAAIDFLDDPPVTTGTLATWFEEHIVRHGFMAQPATASETLFEPVFCRPQDGGGSSVDIAYLTMAARDRVAHTLLSFVVHLDIHRFITEAIETGRVRLDADGLLWQPSPSERDMLSDIVMSLFAADMLNDFAFHARNLCVCRTCLHVSFVPLSTGRTGCEYHRPTMPSGMRTLRCPPR